MSQNSSNINNFCEIYFFKCILSLSIKHPKLNWILILPLLLHVTNRVKHSAKNILILKASNAFIMIFNAINTFNMHENGDQNKSCTKALLHIQFHCPLCSNYRNVIVSFSGILTFQKFISRIILSTKCSWEALRDFYEEWEN